MQTPAVPQRTTAEFIALVALTTSLVALSIDTMLPALGEIGRDLGARDPNDRQLVISSFVAGLTFGLLIYGPLSDSIGRKATLYSGLALFGCGGLLCVFSTNFQVLLAARVLQGLGAAGPRIVSVAMVRDLYSGRAMARLMSLVMSVFILVPVVAPSIGQAILLMADWRAIFYFLLVVAAADLIWVALRQPETLPPERRSRLAPAALLAAARFAFGNPITVGYTVATGFVYGAMINYVTQSQQIFQEQYALGALFPVFFGIVALALGIASLTNAQLVMRFGMRTLSRWAALCECVLSGVFLGIAWSLGGHPPLAAFMVFMLACFFCQGLLFGNYNARAMEPMGAVAGVAAAVTGAGSSVIGLVAATAFGQAYDGTVVPLVAGFAVLSLAALTSTEAVERRYARTITERGVMEQNR